MIYLAPLQGYTDYIYRKVFHNHFRGIDAFFIPYISYRNEKILKNHLREILPANNQNIHVIPQVLIKNSAEALHLFKRLHDFGYNEVNINMGCPYPMVTKSGRGAGLLPFPGKVNEIMDGIFSSETISVSVKLRSGLTSEDEIYKIVEILNHYPLKEIIYHPRTASQLYKGSVNENLFSEITSISVHPMCYNGDLFSKVDFEKKSALFRGINHWMAGRGVLMNPFLPEEILGFDQSSQQKAERMELFHNQLVDGYTGFLSGPGHLLIRLKLIWEYLSYSFPDREKSYKMIKKCKTPDDYAKKTRQLFESLRRS